VGKIKTKKKIANKIIFVLVCDKFFAFLIKGKIRFFFIIKKIKTKGNKDKFYDILRYFDVNNAILGLFRCFSKRKPYF